jgi:hypothetical protein
VSTPTDGAAVRLEVDLSQCLQEGPLGGGQVTSGDELAGQALGLVAGPDLEGGNEGALVAIRPF